MKLPEDLERSFEDNLERYEEEKKMPYITSIERRGIEQGIERGILQKAREAVIEVLQTRFKDLPQSIVDAINDIEDSSVLKILHKRAITINSPEEFEGVLREYS